MLAVLLLLLYLPSTSATITIPTIKLFQNTIKKWAIDLKDDKDRRERWDRLVEAVKSVERTTSGVVLSSLNRFAVANNEEFENIVRPLFEGFNMSATLAGFSKLENKVRKRRRSKRSLPKTFDYWENTVGLSTPLNQASCGSCWSFPNVGTMEALNKHLTGDDTEFSEQYFVDCTFDYSGCAGGVVNEGYKLTKMRQYLVSAEDMPYAADYTPCKILEDIVNFKNNAMTKIWIQDFVPLQSSEVGMLEGLTTSPVAFGTMIGNDLFAYSGGEYRDTQCATNPMPHAMLLVGYTDKTLRVKASYGTDFGDNGYIDYARGDESLLNCGFYKNAFSLLATYRRDLKYAYCNEGHPTTYQQCKDSCQAMDTKHKSGWDLATIPTEYHNNLLVDKLADDYPGEKTDDKFKLFWIGLLDEDRTGAYRWLDGFTPANYINIPSHGRGNHYGLIDENSGEWVTKNSLTFEARGLCSRAVNCWNIENAVQNGNVRFSKADLTEGTEATVKCKEGTLVGSDTLQCIGGQWDQPLPLCSNGGSNGNAPYDVNNGECTVIKSDLFILEPPEEDFIADGEELEAICVNNKKISQTMTCSKGVFQPALNPKTLCSSKSFQTAKAGHSTLSAILALLLGLLMI